MSFDRMFFGTRASAPQEATAFEFSAAITFEKASGFIRDGRCDLIRSAIEQGRLSPTLSNAGFGYCDDLLSVAADSNQLRIFECLFNAGHKSHTKYTGRRNLFHLAASLKGINVKILRTLFEEGVDASAVDEEGETPLVTAMRCQNLNAVRFLAYHDFNSCKECVLCDAIKENLNNDCIVAMIEETTKNTDFFFIESDCQNCKHIPLHLATLTGNADVVMTLVRRRTPVDTCNQMEQTALHIAVAKERLDIVKILVDEGADIHKPDITGQSPLDIAKLYGNPEIAIYMMDNHKLRKPQAQEEE